MFLGHPQTEDLKSARVHDDRSLPTHETVKAPHLLNNLLPRMQVQMKGIGDENLYAYGGKIGDGDGSDGTPRGYGNKGRCFDKAMGSLYPASSGLTVCGQDFKRKFFQCLSGQAVHDLFD